MAGRQGQSSNSPFLGKPVIDDIKREHDHITEAIAKISAEFADITEKEGNAILANERDVSEYQKRIDKFREYQELAKTLTKRIDLLMDLAIEDLDRTLYDAPAHIIDHLSMMTGINYDLYPETDPIRSLDADTVKCIFRVAGYYESDRETKDLKNTIENNPAATATELREKYFTKIPNVAVFGLKLLWITIKLTHVVLIHYTFGYQCGFFKGKWKIGKRWKVAGKRFGFEFKLGEMIAEFFGEIEKKLLKIFGYECNEESGKADPCEPTDLEKGTFNKIKCCTTDPIFFQSDGNRGNSVYIMSKCFEQMYRQELDPNGEPPRIICSVANKMNDGIEPTDEEIERSRQVADYLMHTNTDKTFSANDISMLASARRYTTDATEYSKTSESALMNGKNYVQNGPRGNASGNCFGYTLDTTGGLSAGFQSTLGSNSGDGLPFVEQGMYLFEVTDMIDGIVNDALKYADNITVGTARLAKWGSSRQLCCWVYLTVMMSTMWHSMVVKGKWCPDFNCSDDAKTGESCDAALRRELQWATKLRYSKDMEKFIMLLTVIKQINDMFLRKQKRAVFIAGVKLPIHDMWESVKTIIMSNLSQYLDILFGPLDSLLSGLRGTPEIRNMINNDCFGFMQFLDFLQCLLGNLKASIMEQIYKWISFSMNDIAVMNDIYVSRHRLKSLESFSALLGNILKLLASLKDCYDPQTLVQQTIDKQLEDQYNDYVAYNMLVGERASEIDAATESVMGEEITFTSPDGALNVVFKTFTPFGDSSDFGGELDKIAYNIIKQSTVAASSDGTIRTFADFTEEWLKLQDVTMAEYREGLEHLYTILVGAQE